MLRRVVSVVFVTGVLVALMGAPPSWSVAQTATPVAGTPQAGLELCTKAEIEKGDTGIVVEPPGEVKAGEAGVVKPADAPDHVLWVAEITMMPQSCYEFHPQKGPVVLFVLSGSIEYGVSSGTTPAATVEMGHQSDAATPVALDTFVTLNSGDWLTQDRAARFTYRNPGPGAAVVLMTAYVTPPGDEEGSGGKG